VTTYRGRDGQKRLWFSDWELESISEHELHKAGLLPTPDEPSVDIERLLEKHLRARVDFNAPLPVDVLGQTLFEPDGTVTVLVNADLTGAMEESSDVATTGRWRATIAHEAAHIILHRHLFVADNRQTSFFEQQPQQDARMRCLKREVAFGTTASDWPEVQANKGMAALLMPSSVFSSVTRAKMMALGMDIQAPVHANSLAAATLALYLAKTFEVSRTASKIRLETAGFLLKQGSQLLPV
jgi:hypothetical protein